jgi:hypothetical protein
VRVFLSYRRSDVGGYAGRLADALRERPGERSVFQDVSAIPLGEAFTAAIDRTLDACDAVLAVIGPGWLTAATPDARPRLFEPDDYVRLELARALEREVRVVPVLVGGAELPAAEALPEDLRGLVMRQGMALRDESWHQDGDSLVRLLRSEPGERHQTGAEQTDIEPITGSISLAPLARRPTQPCSTRPPSRSTELACATPGIASTA